MPDADGSDPRAIRVFISSTFRDMQAERDELVKHVFPAVRRRCEERGVTWGEVDLRWGVTDEQKAEGAVLPICLAEIERTRPYFIGLLGQRYGWVPDELPVTPDRPWLAQAAGRSVTELEFLHGVLNDPASAGHAFFYLRDPAWVAALPAAEQSLYVEEDPAGQQRLAGLRDRVRSSGFPVSDYADPRDLGRQVLDDLMRLLDERYPAGEVLDPAAQEDTAHERFAAARRAGAIGRPVLLRRLDDVADASVADTGVPDTGVADTGVADTGVAEAGAAVLVTGEPGTGATTLVADWAARRQESHPEDVVIEHYVTAQASAADWTALVARVTAHLAGRLGLPDAVADPPPVDPVEVRSAFAAALTRAGRLARIVLVIDGVDDLLDVDAAPDLLWLPARIPPGVTVVLTGTAPRAVATVAHRGWATLAVPPLDETERRAVITDYLGRFAKALDEAPTTRLATAAQTGNGLFLRTVLDELRHHGDHLTLGQEMDRLLAAATVDDLLELVLARFERDFERERPGLTRDAFTALWASREGLAEAELLAILGDGDGSPLPHAAWSPLFLSAEGLLVAAGGRLSLADHHVRQAVADRYLPTADDRRAAHARLARYFAGRPMSPRVVAELPWHQWESGDVDGLVRTLADDAFVELAYVLALPDLRRLWSRAEGTGRSMSTAYAGVLADPGAHDPPGPVGPTGRSQLVWAVARLLADAGHGAAALPLQRHLVASARRAPAGLREGPGGTARLRAALVNLGAALWGQGELTAAQEALAEAVTLCREAGADAMLASALGNLAVVTRDAGDLAAAEQLHAEEWVLLESGSDLHAQQAHLGNRAQTLRQLGDHDGALRLLIAQERLCRDAADPAGVARARAGQAVILGDRGDIPAALQLTLDQLAACQEAGDARGMVEARVNESVMRAQMGQATAAEAAAIAAEEQARHLGDGGLLARVLNARALAAAGRGDWGGAGRLAGEAELTARSAGALPAAAVALGIVGTARRELGDLPGCRSAHEEELRVAMATGDPQSIATAHANLGTCGLAENRIEEVLSRYAQAEPTFQRLQVHSSLLPVLANRAQVHESLGDLPRAVADYAGAAASAALLGNADAARLWGERGLQVAYQIGDGASAESLWGSLAVAYRAVGSDEALQRALGERALLLIQRAQPGGGQPGAPGTVDQSLLDVASGLLDEQETLCRRLADPVALAACVGNRAIVLRYRGDLVGSLACLDEQLQLATASQNAQGWVIAMANRGEVLGLLGQVPEALAALQGARDAAAGYGPAYQGMVVQLDAMIAALDSSR